MTYFVISSNEPGFATFEQAAEFAKAKVKENESGAFFRVVKAQADVKVERQPVIVLLPYPQDDKAAQPKRNPLEAFDRLSHEAACRYSD